MRIARFSVNNQIHFGVLEDGKTQIVGLKGDPMYAPIEPSGQLFNLEEVRLLSPVIPRSKVVCVGVNYGKHAVEMGHDLPEEPILFMKPNTSVIGPDDPIVIPAWATRVQHEVELAVVIKTLAKDVPVDEVDQVILGYTVANDVTDRTVQQKDGQWTRAKGWDTSCPLGPWIVVDPNFDPRSVQLECAVNGQVKQEGNTSEMLTPVRELVSFISHAMTLLPGDVILTGTPAGTSDIVSGDRVTCTVAGIGELTNPVVKR